MGSSSNGLSRSSSKWSQQVLRNYIFQSFRELPWPRFGPPGVLAGIHRDFVFSVAVWCRLLMFVVPRLCISGLFFRLCFYDSLMSHALPVPCLNRFIFASFLGIFFGSVFVSVFGLLLGAFLGQFWLRSGLFFHTFSHRFFRYLFCRFWETFRLPFGTLFEPKIEQRVARGRKSRPLKTSVFLK